jgi:hypothetical protein
MKTQVRWKKVGVASVIGVLAVLAATTAYGKYQMRQGVCVKFHPDGSEKLLYGSDCGKPFESSPQATQLGNFNASAAD